MAGAFSSAFSNAFDSGGAPAGLGIPIAAYQRNHNTGDEMQYLKADTITEVTIGPVVAVGDGYVPVTTLVGGDADEFEVIKHGATTTTTVAGTLAAITGADGYYALDLSATDTNTEGRLTVLINDDSLCLPVRCDFMVVNANVFDSLFAVAATDYLQTDAIQVGSQTASASGTVTFPAATIASTTNITAGTIATVTTNTDMRGTDSAALASEVTSARMATLTDWIDGGRLDLLLDAIPTTAMRGTDSAALASEVTSARMATLTDWIDGGRLDLLLDAIPTTAMRGTDSAALASEVTSARMATLTDWIDGGRLDLLLDAIKVITDALGSTGATRLALSAGQIIPFTVDTVTNTHTPLVTEFQADDITEATADHYNGTLIVWTSGVLAGQRTECTDYVAVGGIGQFTVTGMTEAPANNDTGIIL